MHVGLPDVSIPLFGPRGRERPFGLEGGWRKPLFDLLMRFLYLELFVHSG